MVVSLAAGIKLTSNRTLKREKNTKPQRKFHTEFFLGSCPIRTYVVPSLFCALPTNKYHPTQSSHSIRTTQWFLLLLKRKFWLFSSIICKTPFGSGLEPQEKYRKKCILPIFLFFFICYVGCQNVVSTLLQNKKRNTDTDFYHYLVSVKVSIQKGGPGNYIDHYES